MKPCLPLRTGAIPCVFRESPLEHLFPHPLLVSATPHPCLVATRLTQTGTVTIAIAIATPQPRCLPPRPSPSVPRLCDLAHVLSLTRPPRELGCHFLWNAPSSLQLLSSLLFLQELVKTRH